MRLLTADWSVLERLSHTEITINGLKTLRLLTNSPTSLQLVHRTYSEILEDLKEFILAN